MQRGIVLHRAIDGFTDEHPATAKAKQVFRPHYRLYSGPIVDIVYDHFLANDKEVFPNDSLLAFTNNVYQTMEEEAVHLPQRFLPVFTYMRLENWLYNYRTTEGIGKSLRGLVRRAAFISDSATAIELLHERYDELQACYAEFFPAVKQFAKQKLDELLA